MKKRILCFSLITIFCIITFKTGDIFGARNIFVKPSVTNVIENEEFEISIHIENLSVAALQIELYFDNEKVEYISGPENSNNISNAILYTWFDIAGGRNSKQNEEIVRFKFKAKKAGEALFGLNGMFFDKNGNEIVSSLNGTSIYIREAEKA